MATVCSPDPLLSWNLPEPSEEGPGPAPWMTALVHLRTAPSLCIPTFPSPPLASPRPSSSPLTPPTPDRGSGCSLSPTTSGSRNLSLKRPRHSCLFLLFLLPPGGSEDNSWGLKEPQKAEGPAPVAPLWPRPRAPQGLAWPVPAPQNLCLCSLACLDCPFLPFRTQPTAPPQMALSLTTHVVQPHSPVLVTLFTL